MDRRQFLTALSIGSLVAPVLRADTAGFSTTIDYSLLCLGSASGLRYLDGRTQNGSVGLVKALVKPFSGTRWRIHSAGTNGAISFECRGQIQGPRWLDGRTKDATVGLAPNRQLPFTGTVWQAVPMNGYYLLKCLGNIDGPRWLDGQPAQGSVGLAKSADPPSPGIRWQIKPYPVCFDGPCGLP